MYASGYGNTSRRLFAVFTVRNNKIRIISVRDMSKKERITFPNLKPSTKMISLRLPEALLERLKTLANKNDVPFQSLIKILLSEKVNEEFKKVG